MKRITSVLALLLSFAAFAQEGTKLSSAIIADRNGNVVDAYKYITEARDIIDKKAAEEVSYKDMRKYLYYMGSIHLKIAKSDDPTVSALDSNALQVAEKYLLETIRYEKELDKEKFSDDAKALLPELANTYNQKALTAYQANDYKPAYDAFMKTYTLRLMENQTDSSTLYNAALMAQNGKLYEQAIEANKKLIDLGYKGYEYKATNDQGQTVAFPSKKVMDLYTVEGSGYTDPQVVANDLRPQFYINIANMSMAEGDTAGFIEYVKLGRAKFPENGALLTTELDLYLKSKQYDKALINLDEALAQDSTSNTARLYYYNKGIILQTEMNKPEEAIKAYEKAVAIDENYGDALYMSGLVYYNRAKEITDEMNKLPLNATKKYDALKAKQQENFKKALPYFERALKATPEDRNTMLALLEIYRSLKMVEEAKEIRGKLGQ